MFKKVKSSLRIIKDDLKNRNYSEIDILDYSFNSKIFNHALETIEDMIKHVDIVDKETFSKFEDACFFDGYVDNIFIFKDIYNKIKNNDIFISTSYFLNYYDCDTHIYYNEIRMNSYNYNEYDDIDWNEFKIIYRFYDKTDDADYKYKVLGLKNNDINLYNAFEDLYNLFLNLDVTAKGLEDYLYEYKKCDDDKILSIVLTLNDCRKVSLGDLRRILKRMRSD